MKINEVEQLVGITKKNIRFYEDQKLICPQRNKENGYRDYNDDDIKTLQQIKLMRKLGVSIEEIRRMQKGVCTVSDVMRGHKITLEREKQNLDKSAELCALLEVENKSLNSLNAGEMLLKMENMERGGTLFKDNHIEDVKPVHYIVPVLTAMLISIVMAGIIGLMIWTFNEEPEQNPPFIIMAAFILIPVVVIAGTIIALVQRLGEIKKGEERDARKY